MSPTQLQAYDDEFKKQAIARHQSLDAEQQKTSEPHLAEFLGSSPTSLIRRIARGDDDLTHDISTHLLFDHPLLRAYDPAKGSMMGYIAGTAALTHKKITSEKRREGSLSGLEEDRVGMVPTKELAKSTIPADRDNFHIQGILRRVQSAGESGVSRTGLKPTGDRDVGRLIYDRLLEQLEKEGKIVRKTIKPAMGRPQTRYYSTEHASKLSRRGKAKKFARLLSDDEMIPFLSAADENMLSSPNTDNGGPFDNGEVIPYHILADLMEEEGDPRHELYRSTAERRERKNSHIIHTLVHDLGVDPEKARSIRPTYRSSRYFGPWSVKTFYHPEIGLYHQISHAADGRIDHSYHHFGEKSFPHEKALEFADQVKLADQKAGDWMKEEIKRVANHHEHEQPEETNRPHTMSRKPTKFALVKYEHIHPDLHPIGGIAPRLGEFLHRLSTDKDPDIADMSEAVLRSGSTNALPVLHQMLKDAKHSHADEFDLTHAPRAIAIDRALRKEISKGEDVKGHDGKWKPLTASYVIDQLRFPTMRKRLSKQRALNVVRRSVPDANSRDILHSLLRLRANDVEKGDLHSSVLPSELKGWVKKHENYLLAKFGAIPVNVHRYPPTKPGKHDTAPLMDREVPLEAASAAGHEPNKIGEDAPTVNIRNMQKMDRQGKPSKFARPVPVNEMHPELRFTRLGAVLRHHVQNGDHQDPAIAMADMALTGSPHDQPLDTTPLKVMRDYMLENPDHELAKQFNWEMLPEKVELDMKMKSGDLTPTGFDNRRFLSGIVTDPDSDFHGKNWRIDEAARIAKLHGLDWVDRNHIKDSARRISNQSALLFQTDGNDEDGFLHDYDANDSYPPDHHSRYSRKPSMFAAHEQSNLAQALARMHSSTEKVYKDELGKLLKRTGLSPHKVFNVLHDTPTSVKPTVAASILRDSTPEQAAYAASWHGLLTKQPAVLLFHSHPEGEDSLYRMKLSHKPAEIRAMLDKIGIDNRLLVPKKEWTEVVVHDPKRVHRKKISKLANGLGVGVEEMTGQGRIIGGKDEAAARSKYRDVIREFESQS